METQEPKTIFDCRISKMQGCGGPDYMEIRFSI